MRTILGVSMYYKILFSISVLCFANMLSAYVQEEISLPEKYKKWIEEEVVYIITENEKEVFPQLETNKERDLFIEEFWEQRDPTPGTPRNEFREEHYRRIEYANKNLGKGFSGEGWQSDQGRIYITLGEPIYIDKYINMTECHPIEIWYYQGNIKFSQVSIFRLLFFRRGGSGPFELYSPTSDGPQVLTAWSSMRLPSSYDDRTSKRVDQWRSVIVDNKDLAAYEVLSKVSLELAEASWSSFPTRSGPDQAMPTDILIGQVRTYPQKKVKDDYVYDILENKAVVDVSYSVNYINHKAQIKTLQDDTGMFFVNYCIEPEVLSVDFYLDKYFTNLRTSIRVTDISGNTVFQHLKEFPIELKKKQLMNVLERPFNLVDSFPLIPGVYKFIFLMENLVTKEYLTFEKYVSIPESDTLRIGSMIFAKKVNRESASDELHKAFQVGDLQIYPSVGNQFYKKEKLYLFFQIYGLGEELKDKGQLEYVFTKEDKKVHSLVMDIRKYRNERDFLEEFDLNKFSAGDYKVIISVVDQEKKRILTKEADFSLVADKLPETWVISQPGPPVKDPVYSYIIANQFMNKGEINKAKAEFEKAYNAKKDSLDFALGLAKTYILLEKNEEAKQILLPFHEDQIESFDLDFYLGVVSQELREFKDAVVYYQKALSQRGNVITVLNSIGECYLMLGNRDQAVHTWEKSLEINPNQEDIKKRLAVAKEKK